MEENPLTKNQIKYAYYLSFLPIDRGKEKKSKRTYNEIARVLNSKYYEGKRTIKTAQVREALKDESSLRKLLDDVWHLSLKKPATRPRKSRKFRR